MLRHLLRDIREKKDAKSKWGRQAYAGDCRELGKSVICVWVMCFSGEKQVSIRFQALHIQRKANVAAASASLQKLPRTLDANRVRQKVSNF